MTAPRSDGQFSAIRTEGGLLPPDLLVRVQTLDSALDGLKPADYGLDPSERVNRGIDEAWQALQTHWASFQRTRELVERNQESGTSETRAWVQMVLRELGYGELRFVAAAETIDGRDFLISHRAGESENAPPFQVVSFRQGIDERATRTGGGERRSPQALMQGYLNASDHLWGVVTNGFVFRLLRENRQIDRSLMLEFDLRGIIESESYAEFRLFWLLLHRSRFVQPGERRETAWLERWTQQAASDGARALDGLRQGVEDAIEALGQGLLSHPGNVDLQKRLADGSLDVDDYYSQLLRLVYRLLFLLVAEERNLLFKPETDPGIVGRYRKHYGVDRLRALSRNARKRDDRYDDLWRGLLVTFDALRDPDGAHLLGLEPLGGGLFGPGSCPDVGDEVAGAARPLVGNGALLSAIGALSEVTRDGITRRINYRDLDVEELGGVYEGLLEHRPALEALPGGGYRFGFDASTSRKETGSYYTNPGLVQELIQSALMPVIEERLGRAHTPAEKRAALLDLKVCDPACGSGHFLLAAARRIGRELAAIESGGDEPTAAGIRHGVREAIQHCVYGVDLNPLAVDLCKVALWLEAHEPGKPVGFLDHHIRQGNSLIGATPEVMTDGIPTDAFKEVTGDEKAYASAIRKRNTQEQKGQLGFTWTVTPIADGEALRSYFGVLESEDDSVATVAEKGVLYKRHRQSPDYWRKQLIADLWTAAFFWPLQTGAPEPPTQATWERLANDPRLVDYINPKKKDEVKGTDEYRTVRKARSLSKANSFFHWHLEFEDVFGRDDPGFDVILGNPPWERIKLQEQEFFESRDDAIRNAPNAAARKKLIAALKTSDKPGDRQLFQAYEDALRASECESTFIRTSTSYPLTGRGDVNTYFDLRRTHGEANSDEWTGRHHCPDRHRDRRHKQVLLRLARRREPDRVAVRFRKPRKTSSPR